MSLTQVQIKRKESEDASQYNVVNTQVYALLKVKDFTKTISLFKGHPVLKVKGWG